MKQKPNSTNDTTKQIPTVIIIEQFNNPTLQETLQTVTPQEFDRR